MKAVLPKHFMLLECHGQFCKLTVNEKNGHLTGRCEDSAQSLRVSIIIIIIVIIIIKVLVVIVGSESSN